MGRRIRQAASVAGYNFRQWKDNPRIAVTFLLAFILCFLLTDKAVGFAREHETTMQVLEPFIWTFGDSNSILLSSLLLLLLFADMPFLSPGTPFYLMRMDRKTWILGQLLYTALAALLYLLFILAATSLVCMTNAFSGNLWSKTAAILGYSGEGEVIALPALVKTLEMSRPYQCAATIFLLMLLYTLVLVFLLNPENLKNLFRLPEELAYKARVWVGWLSPLNQATYHMHNFGYDRLPRLWQTYLIFGALLLALVFLSFRAIRRYSFSFRGTENG